MVRACIPNMPWRENHWRSPQKIPGSRLVPQMGPQHQDPELGLRVSMLLEWDLIRVRGTVRGKGLRERKKGLTMGKGPH